MNLLLTPLGGLFVLIRIGMLALGLWAFIDAATRPAARFPAAGKRTKGFWLALTGVGALLLFLSGLGILGLAALVAVIVYLVDVRPAVRSLGGGGSSWGGSGGGSWG